MGYLIRMAPEVGGWLAAVRDRDPAAADLIDEAVAALRAGGESVGPPLVVPLDDPPLNPHPDLDAAYGRQVERLTRLRRAVADAATSRKRLELEAGQLEQHLAKLGEQIRNALETGRGDLAEQAGERRRAAEERLAEMRRLHAGMQAEEERLTMTSYRLQDKVSAFRTRKEALKASWAAAEAAAEAAWAESSHRAPLCFSPRAWKATGCAPGTPKPSRIAASATSASRGTRADAGFSAYPAVWKPQRRRCTG